MRQVVLREGKAMIEEVPRPRSEAGRVLVRTAWSVISAGTERAALRGGAREPLWSEAADPDRLRRAWEVLRDEGPQGVLERLRARDAPATVPGYAAAGVVQEAGAGVADLPPGTRVACAGAGYASHAEWIAVPRNLVVPVPATVPLDEAAFATLGAIALQGVRRAQAQIGEAIVVLGLGLIGNLTAQIARAAGARVIGFDLDARRAARLHGDGIEASSLASADPLEAVPRLTAGLLADAVIVCASSSGPEVVRLAMRLCRRRGRVVIVGDVGLQIDRGLMYEKELDLVMSTSYGPGRYDPAYEEKGIDYPAAYVRWTENRNMDAFLGLVRDGRVAVRPIIDRVFPHAEAAAAYAALDAGGGEPGPLGILLRYAEAPDEAGPDAAPVAAGRGVAAPLPDPAFDPLPAGASPIGVGLCGAGAFVKAVHLPILRRGRDWTVRAVACGSPWNARETARRQRIPVAASGLGDLVAAPGIDLVVIGTRHHLHAAQAREALTAGKHVFVEKPPCLDEADLEPLLLEARRSRRLLAVGFNRRHSPLAVRAREVIDRLSGPALALYRVNAGALPADHWTHDRAVGGGRIVGECCHFVDLLLFLLRESTADVQALALPSDRVGVVAGDSFAALLSFPSGSRAVLAYTGLGDPSLPKERLEIFRRGTALVIDDFRTLAVHGREGGSLDLRRQDKGFEAQWDAVAAALRGAPSPLHRLDEIAATMRVTFRLDRAVRGERCAS